MKEEYPPFWNDPNYHDSWTPLAYQWGMLKRLHELDALHLAPNGKNRYENFARTNHGDDDMGDPLTYAAGRKTADDLYEESKR